MKKITVLLIDDHQLLIDAWHSLLNCDERFEVIGKTADATTAYNIVSNVHPQVVLCDINLTPVDGFAITEKIRQLNRSSRVIGVSMYVLPSYAKKMMQCGAMGYVTKNSTVQELKQAILEVNLGKKYICNEIKDMLAGEKLIPEDEPNLAARLTKKEIAIIKDVKLGFSSKEIAPRHGIGIKTVEVHRYNILRKLNLKNTIALVNFMNAQGL